MPLASSAVATPVPTGPPPGMLFGGLGLLGDTTTTPLGFSDGLNLWGSPSAGFSAAQSAITNASTSFSSTSLPYTLGVLAPPALLLLIVLGGLGGRR